MKIVVTGPEPESHLNAVLTKRDGMVLVRCDCACAYQCPQGKMGSEPRCQMWLKAEHVTEAKVQATRLENRFTR